MCAMILFLISHYKTKRPCGCDEKSSQIKYSDKKKNTITK